MKVFRFDPFRRFVRVAPTSPRPEHPKQAMIDVDVDLATDNVTVVERPSTERPVEMGDDLFLPGVGMHLEPGSDLGQFRRHLFLLRFDQQCALVPAQVETQEVEPIVDMDDARFLFSR